MIARIKGKTLVLLVALAFALAAAPAGAQNVRPSVQVDTGTAVPAYKPSVDSDGDLSAIVYNADISAGVYVTTSDGRGIHWNTPVRVDADPGAALKYTQFDSCIVVKNRIYAAWEDERNGATNEDVYFNYSTDGGATWKGEAWVNKGYPAGTAVVRDWRFDVSGDHVCFLITVDPTGSADEELYFVASHDGGQNFQAPVHVPQGFAPGAYDIDLMVMAVEGLNVHVVWQDDRCGSASNDDVFYQKSIDGGATWLASDVQLDGSGPGVGDADGELSAVSMGNLVAIGWQEELTSSSNEEIRVNVSTDGGATWNGDVMVGGYNPLLQDVDSVWLALGDNNGTTTIACTWCDNSSSTDEVYVATSLDNGATWPHETQVSTAGGSYARFPRIDMIPLSLAVTFTTGDYPNRSEGAFSNDGGVTWTTVQTSTTTGDVDYAEIGFNVFYNNVICAWLSDDLGGSNLNNVYTGGYRPQTLTAVGTFTAGSPVNFEISHWPVGSGDPNFGVFGSGSLGNHLLPFGDIRNSGLARDNYVTVSINQMPGVLFRGVRPDGTGRTLIFPFPGGIPPGTTLYFIALGLDPGTSPVGLGAMTDIVTVVVL
jgi:hypothetical protein